MAITGGDDWNNFVKDFEDSQFFVNTAIFTTYIAFATLVMLNLVTGVFVEGAQRIIREDKENEVVRMAGKIFSTADTDQSETISWEEFLGLGHQPIMKEYMRLLELSSAEMRQLFLILDADDSG